MGLAADIKGRQRPDVECGSNRNAKVVTFTAVTIEKLEFKG